MQRPAEGGAESGFVARGAWGSLIFMGVATDLEGSYTVAIWVLAVLSFLLVPLPLLMASPTKVPPPLDAPERGVGGEQPDASPTTA